MIPFHDDPLAQAGFAVNSATPSTPLERDLLDVIRNLLDYAIGADDDYWRAQQAREAAESELWTLKRQMTARAEAA